MLEAYKDVLTVKDLCEILRIGRNTAYKMLQTQEIPNKQIYGRRYIIPKKYVIAYLDSCYIVS